MRTNIVESLGQIEIYPYEDNDLRITVYRSGKIQWPSNYTAGMSSSSIKETELFILAMEEAVRISKERSKK